MVQTRGQGRRDLLNKKLPLGHKQTFHAIKKKKNTSTNMALGGQPTKRVRATEPSQGQTPQCPTRTSKRLQRSAADGQNVEDPTHGHDETPQGSHTVAEEANGGGGQDSTAADSGAAAQYNTCAGEDSGATEEDTQAPAQRAPRKPRPPTKGAQLQRMTKSMGKRLPISVAEGKRRPHEPVQAAKFASESGVVIQDSVPILPHWKEYKNNKKYFDGFVGGLSGCLAINKDHIPTKEACTDMLHCGVRQMRYRLKQKYFNGVPANEIPTTSPVACMSDED